MDGEGEGTLLGESDAVGTGTAVGPFKEGRALGNWDGASDGRGDNEGRMEDVGGALLVLPTGVLAVVGPSVELVEGSC